MDENAKQALAAALDRLARSRGDEEAWTSLYKLMWPFVLATNFRALGGQRETAEDASQEVFLRLIRYCPFDVLQDPDEFRAYLRRMCVNVVRDIFTKAAREETPLREPGADETVAAGDQPTPEQGAIAHDLLAFARGRLTEEENQLIEMLVMGLSIGETSQELGISYEAAAVRIHRLRGRLSKYMKKI